MGGFFRHRIPLITAFEAAVVAEVSFEEKDPERAV
jgi:hypothetical protein